MAVIEKMQRATGRLIGALRREFKEEFRRVAEELTGKENFVLASSLPDRTDFCALGSEISVLFDNIDTALIAGKLASLRDSKFFTVVEPERVSPIPFPPFIGPVTKAEARCMDDTRQRTWGVHITGAFPSGSAAHIKLAILDSGIKMTHEAFSGRTFPMRSFVSTAADVDEIGHGTHCAGIICGRPDTEWNRHFSVAPDVDLHVAKIFDQRREACDSRILAAVDWAVGKGCEIISMSIGGHIPRGMGYSRVFNEAARSAADKGVLLIAGAGNESNRSASTPIHSTVSHPANCPFIMAVGAIDDCGKIANFSNRSFDPNGGEINIVAPGLAIRSAQARGTRDDYIRQDGTSAAVPFVAGIAALWAKARGEHGLKLWKLLEREADDLGLPVIDGGAGLVKAP